MGIRLLKTARDFQKELAVQKALERQFKAKLALKALREKNRQLVKQLHPETKSRAKKLLKIFGRETKAGLIEARKGLKKFKKERRRGKRISQIIGLR